MGNYDRWVTILQAQLQQRWLGLEDAARQHVKQSLLATLPSKVHISGKACVCALMLLTRVKNIAATTTITSLRCTATIPLKHPPLYMWMVYHTSVHHLVYNGRSVTPSQHPKLTA